MRPQQIIEEWHALGESTQLYGREWYGTAHDTALTIARDTGHEHSRVCGVIARLSPSCPWNANVRYARELCEIGELTNGYQGYPRNVERARDILANGWTDAPYGPKVNAFYRNILNPADPDPVTLDRHMLWWLGEDWTRAARGKRYEQLSEPFRVAGRTLGLPANVLQAALWLDAREGWRNSA